jgi:hypothetical protein
MNRTDRVIACAIIKDEPALADTLESLRTVLGDALAGIVLHETSEDERNADALETRLQDVAVAAFVSHRTFDNFAGARNACLDEAEIVASGVGAPWLLMFSGGATFSGSWRPPEGDNEALAHTELCGDLEFRKVGPIRANSDLRYVGRTHESIDAGPVESLPHCGLIVDYSADFDPEKKAARWRQDIALLADDYSPRGRFYLAQSFKCLGIVHEAFAYSMIRAEMHGYEPERRQAVVYAVETAPTLGLARYAASRAPDCADVQLALAERCFAVRDPAVEQAIVLAASLEDRSMFANRRLHERCVELHATIKGATYE